MQSLFFSSFSSASYCDLSSFNRSERVIIYLDIVIEPFDPALVLWFVFRRSKGIVLGVLLDPNEEKRARKYSTIWMARNIKRATS